MQEKIIAELKKLETEQDIEILYACESGSRAWGFPSTDSDYDVRFIYVQSPKRYLSIYDRKDAIDLFLAEDLDFIGWDIRKALRLFHKSNASPFEWMQSPIIYKEHPIFMKKLRELASDYFSPRATIHHYLGIAKHTYLGHLQGEQVKIKKYFYALRPLFCAMWIVENRTYPPLQFHDLFPLIDHDKELMENVEGLLTRKANSYETDVITPIPFFHEFIEQKLAEFEDTFHDFDKTKIDAEPLNNLFREIVM
jgi:hypothetical protein